MRRSQAPLCYWVAVIAALAIGSALLMPQLAWLHYIAKPLATILILIVALKANPPVSPRYKRLVGAGIFFGLIGDVFLMLPGDRFVPGLAAFLLGHLCFIAAYFPGGTWRARLLALLAYAALAAVNLAFLLPRVPHALVIPVLAYVGVLVLMAACAAARAWTLRHAVGGLAKPALLAGIGGALFLASDTLLAWNKFGGGLPWQALWVLGTYYWAQWLFARAAQRVS